MSRPFIPICAGAPSDRSRQVPLLARAVTTPNSHSRPMAVTVASPPMAGNPTSLSLLPKLFTCKCLYAARDRGGDKFADAQNVVATSRQQQDKGCANGALVRTAGEGAAFTSS